MKGDLNVMMFIHEEDWINNMPFKYYKYRGSNTQPPCAENVIWYVLSEKKEISSTILVMFRLSYFYFRDVLNVPLQVSSSTNLNYDGSNR